MVKNVLVYKRDEYRHGMVVRNLKSLGMQVVECGEPFSDDHTDAGFLQVILNLVQNYSIQLVFSWNYFPLLASACEISKIPYAAWIYECPLRTLASKTVLYKHNYLFCFDLLYAKRLAALGCENVFHFPPAVDTEQLETMIAAGNAESAAYEDDVAFVGNVSSKMESWWKNEEIPEYVRGYLDGIVQAQLKVYGYNFVREMIQEDMAEDLLKKIDVYHNEMYFFNPVQTVADLVNEEVTRREGTDAIEEISKIHGIKAYTDLQYKGDDCDHLRGSAEDQSQFPHIFRNSRINLNITPKTIESGIPVRVLDILACGGFCLTNYQPEIAEYFEDGAELVMYTDMKDLVNKISWYLQHEEERKAIARAGQERVRKDFDLEKKLAELLELVDAEFGSI